MFQRVRVGIPPRNFERREFMLATGRDQRHLLLAHRRDDAILLVFFQLRLIGIGLQPRYRRRQHFGELPGGQTAHP